MFHIYFIQNFNPVFILYKSVATFLWEYKLFLSLELHIFKKEETFTFCSKICKQESFLLVNLCIPVLNFSVKRVDLKLIKLKENLKQPGC